MPTLAFLLQFPTTALAPGEAAVMGEMRQTGCVSLQPLPQGSHCALVPMPPLWGQRGCSSPAMSLHGEPTVPSLLQDSSWTPPGSICFRLESLSSPRADSPCKGQSPRRMLVLPCLFSGFLSRLLQASGITDASRKTPLPHNKGMCTGRFCSCGDLVQCLSLVPSAPGAAGDTFTKSWPAAGPGSRHAAISAKVSCLCEISTNKCYNYTQPTTGLLANI